MSRLLKRIVLRKSPYEHGRIETDLTGVFRKIYDREPNPEEATTLGQLKVVPGNYASAFRAVIGSFDRQVLNTPFAVRCSGADVSFIRVEDVMLAADAADRTVSYVLLMGQPYEPHLFRFFKEWVKPGMTLVDLGANIGFYSMVGARLVGPSGKVFSFEPNSENCRLILLSKEKNHFDNVVLYPVAASDRRGYGLFSTYIGANGGLTPTSEEQLLRPSCIVVPTFPLQDLIQERVDLIKIDTEGAEGLVINGARSLIEQYRPVVISEFSMEMLPRVSKMSGHKYLSYFQGLGYELNVISRTEEALVPITSIDGFLQNY
ncbi:MAG TPA: FkbM family methyltransferase, partial [Gemmataceae bacterium]|nr:FkbM family methyltransferase [Gemmataceae bacterium]